MAFPWCERIVAWFRSVPRAVSEMEQRRDARYRRQLLACKVHVVGNGSELTVRVPFIGIVPSDWFARARYAVCLDDHNFGSIVVCARVAESGDGYRTLACTPRSVISGLLLRRFCHTRQMTELSNVIAIEIATDTGSIRVPNILYDHGATAIPNEPNFFG